MAQFELIDKVLRQFWDLKYWFDDEEPNFEKKVWKADFIDDLKFEWGFEVFSISLEQLGISGKSFGSVQVEFHISVKFQF